MLLDFFGIRTNEAEMTRLSETNNLTGTYMDKLASAVSLKIKPLGLKAVYEKTDYEKLKPFLKPFITKMKLRFMVDHYVVVFDVKDGEVTVGDPLEGREVYSRKQFLKNWRRVVLRVYKNNPAQTEGSLKIT